VTAEERDELYLAIETALPQGIRADVRGRRRAVRDQQRAARDAARVAASEARLRDAPLDRWDFMVAGCRYEGRPAVIHGYARPGDTAFLSRDPDNAFSRNATEIRLSNGLQVGYVPEEDATEIAPMLDAGHPHQAYIKKILTGGRYPIPVVVATLYSPAAVVPGLVHQQGVPPKQALPAAAPPLRADETSGLRYVLILIIIAIVVAFALGVLR
jgi:hypothetical protein